MQQLVRNTGVVFGALSERRGQLRGLITNANAVFQTTADRNDNLYRPPPWSGTRGCTPAALAETCRYRDGAVL